MTQTDNKRIHVAGSCIPLPGNNIDTDRIIPARFMKCVTFEGLEAYAFYEERFNDDGAEKEHSMNDPRFKGGSIFIVNKNFGCGSSREHAPQAMARFGMKAIIGESFAEIFIGNCVSLGIPAVTADAEAIVALSQAIEANPTLEVQIDLDEKVARYSDLIVVVDIPEAARQSLIEGTWDSTAQLYANLEQINVCIEALPYI